MLPAHAMRVIGWPSCVNHVDDMVLVGFGEVVVQRQDQRSLVSRSVAGSGPVVV